MRIKIFFCILAAGNLFQEALLPPTFRTKNKTKKKCFKIILFFYI